MSVAYKCNDCSQYFEGSLTLEGEELMVQPASPSKHYCPLCLARRAKRLVEHIIYREEQKNK